MNDNKIRKFYKRAEERYGWPTMWAVMIFVLQIDMETWKFPEHLHNTQFGDLIDKIEQDKEMREVFQSK